MPRQLPPDVTHFTGRSTEISRLHEFLAGATAGDRQMAVCTIVGAAGVGKTALAVHWAYLIRDRFPDGQLYVNLRGYAPGPSVGPGDVLEGFLRAFDVPGEKIPQGLEARVGLYRSLLASLQVLVVLDNASQAEQVRPLLSGAPGAMMIVTSRSALTGLAVSDGSVPLALGSLPPTDAVDLLRKVAGMQISDDDTATVEALARRCGYLPLALRIAGTRIAHDKDTASTLADSLAVERDRLDVLASDGDESTTVRAVFSWSYRALPVDAARAFRLLSLHTGPDIGSGASAAVIGGRLPQARTLLGLLTENNLVERSGPDRYRFHDLLRAYAVEKMAEEDDASARVAAVRRLLSWYLASADAASQVIAPQRRGIPLAEPQASPLQFNDHATALAWYEAERENLLAVARLALDNEQYSAAWQLPAAVWAFHNLRKYWTDWIEMHSIGLAGARAAGDRTGEGWMLNNLGDAYRYLRRYDEAMDCFQHALAVRRSISDQQGVAGTLHNLATLSRDLGKFTEACDYYEQTLVIRDEVGDRWGKGLTLNNLGDVLTRMGRAGEAIERHNQALAVFTAIDDRHGEGIALHGMGCAFLAQQDYSRAIDYLGRALEIRRATGNRWGEAGTLDKLAMAYTGQGREREARTCLELAVAILDDLGDPRAAEVRARLDGAGGLAV